MLLLRRAEQAVEQERRPRTLAQRADQPAPLVTQGDGQAVDLRLGGEGETLYCFQAEEAAARGVGIWDGRSCGTDQLGPAANAVPPASRKVASRAPTNRLSLCTLYLLCQGPDPSPTGVPHTNGSPIGLALSFQAPPASCPGPYPKR